MNRRSSPGIILFDSRGTIRYANQEAQEIVPSLLSPRQQGAEGISRFQGYWDEFVRRMIGFPLPTDPFHEPFLLTEIMESVWGVPLSVRGFLLNSSEGKNGNHQYLVLIEMIAEDRKYPLSGIQERFHLSERELEVLRLVGFGLSNQEISERLFISLYTVKDHIKHLKAKLGVASRNLMVASFNREKLSE